MPLVIRRGPFIIGITMNFGAMVCHTPRLGHNLSKNYVEYMSTPIYLRHYNCISCGLSHTRANTEGGEIICLLTILSPQDNSLESTYDAFFISCEEILDTHSSKLIIATLGRR